MRRRGQRWAVGLGAWALAGCGYRPIAPPDGGLSVAGAAPRVARPGVVEAALAGSRDELAAQGALSSAPYPRMVVELLRVDELSEGIRVAAGRPLARGSRVTVTGRAWVLESHGGPPRWDTGDMSRAALQAAGPDATSDTRLHDAAAREAGRQLGRALARRVLGDAEPARAE
ncbi:MAG: hypothetical protein IT376_23080 [Polyangiaceae bacterium]|nr:hypothetical protein [Polyangiaceae bacterium]